MLKLDLTNLEPFIEIYLKSRRTAPRFVPSYNGIGRRDIPWSSACALQKDFLR